MKHFERSLPMMLYRTLDVVMPSFRRIFKEFGLTEQQWRVLRVLWERDGCVLSELAEATLIPAPSLVGILDRLERNGMLTRRRSKSDRRKVHIFVSREGKELEQQVSPKVDEAYAELEASIDSAQWAQLLHAMDRLIEQAQRPDSTSSSTAALQDRKRAQAYRRSATTKS